MEGEIRLRGIRLVVEKTVPANGQISGFSEFAGQRVKVVICDPDPEAPPLTKGKKGG